MQRLHLDDESHTLALLGDVQQYFEVGDEVPHFDFELFDFVDSGSYFRLQHDPLIPE